MKVHSYRVYRRSGGSSVVFDTKTIAFFEADSRNLALLKKLAFGSSVPRDQLSEIIDSGIIDDEIAQEQDACQPGIVTEPSAFRIVLGENCNLRCEGCFVTERESKLSAMTADTLQQVVATSLGYTGERKATFHFFGGEPLLYLDRIVEAVKLAKTLCSCKYPLPEFAITTNLTLLGAEAISVFKEFAFQVGVSIDGPRKVNDRFRVGKDGAGTYELVKSNYQRLLAENIDAHILITPHSETINALPEILEALLPDFPSTTVTINTPLQQKSLGWDVNGARYAETLVALERSARRLSITIDSALSPPLAAICEATPRTSPCSIRGGSTMVSVASDGLVSPCPQNWDTRVPLTKLGECSDSSGNQKTRECESCVARNLCGGPCPVFQTKTKRRVDGHRCAFMKSLPRLIATNLDLFTE